MELSSGCLLGLSSGEILNVVDLHASHKCESESATHSSDDDTHMLLSTAEDVPTSGTSCITSSMDFEFPNNDLGTSEFTMEHSSMFDIPESVIEENEKVELFKDSGIFDENTTKNSSEVESLISTNTKKLNLYKELGLKLQVIPLNNLQFVSTVQTNEGVHILAVPAGSTYRDCGLGSTLVSNIILQQETECKTSGNNESHGVEVVNITTSKISQQSASNMSPKIEIINIIPKSDIIPSLTNMEKLASLGQNMKSTIMATIKTKETGLEEEKNIQLSQQLAQMKHKNKTVSVKYPAEKSLLKNSERNEAVSLAGTAVNPMHVAKKMVSLLKSHRPNRITLRKSDNQVVALPKTKFSNHSYPIQKNVIVDFQEMLPKKTESRMVSLLNGSFSKQVLSLKESCHSVIDRKQMKLIVRVKSNKKQVQKKGFVKSFRYLSNIKGAKDTDLCPASCTKVNKRALKIKSLVTTNDLRKRSYGQDNDKESSEDVRNNIRNNLTETKEFDPQKTLTVMSKHKCELCQAVFLRKGNYINHMEIHNHISKDHFLIQENIASQGAISQPNISSTATVSNIIKQPSILVVPPRPTTVMTHYPSPTTKQLHYVSSAHDTLHQTKRFVSNIVQGNMPTMLHKTVTPQLLLNQAQKHGLLKSTSNISSETKSVFCQITDQLPDLPGHKAVVKLDIECTFLSDPVQVQTSMSNMITEKTIKDADDTNKINVDLPHDIISEPCIDTHDQVIHSSDRIKSNADSITEEHNSNVTMTTEENSESSGIACPGQSSSQWRCELCLMTFVNEGNLTRHRLNHAATAKGVARFKCEMCSKTFLQKCDLRRHAILHSEQFPFTCRICGKGFIRRSDLKTHERFHSGERAYQCDRCSKAYYQSGDLYRHKKTSHGDCGDFACPHCGKTYKSHKALLMHTANKHPSSIPGSGGNMV